MWFYFAVLSAVLSSVSMVARKTHGSLAHPMELCWWALLLGTPLGIGLLLTSNQPYFSDLNFIIPATISALMGIASSSLAFYAFQKGDTSALAPIGNLLPIMMIGISFLLLGTLPGFISIIGILLVVAGTYYSSVTKADLTHPLKELMHSAGPRAMLGCVILWSISANFDKLAMESASPAFILTYRQIVSLIVLSIILLLHPQRHRWRRGQRVIKRWGWHIVGIAVFSTLAVYFQFAAIKLIDPVYVLTVKRMDVLFAILIAYFIYKEKHVARRFQGALVALVGIVIICFASL